MGIGCSGNQIIPSSTSGTPRITTVKNNDFRAFTTKALVSLAFFLGANSLYQGNLERKHNFRNIVATEGHIPYMISTVNERNTRTMKV